MTYRWNRVATFSLCALGLILLFCAPARAECVAKPGSIFFVTDREPLDDNQLFSGEWGTDANHQPVITTGVISMPVDKANESRCTSKQAFIDAVKSQFVKNRPRQLLVYVHGYYTSFVAAAETALALQKGLHFPGPLILYSWPSRKTSVLAYGTDEDNAEWSMPHFTRFLGEINKAFPGMPVSLAGYSLGSRFVTGGIAFFRRGGCKNLLRACGSVRTRRVHGGLAQRAYGFEPVLGETANESDCFRTRAPLRLEQRPGVETIGKVPWKSARGASRRRSRSVQRCRHGRRQLPQERR